MMIVQIALLGLLTVLNTADEIVCNNSFDEASVRYSNGDVPLAAAWLTPANMDSGTPAIVILQGSGTSDRTNLWSRRFAETLGACGIAVLLTDKRGSGRSGGDWELATFNDLARDGVAGLEFVATQPRIDTDRIGFLGLSQGGRIAPLAATLASETDFVVSVSAGVIPLKDSLIYELEQTYRQHGIPEADVPGLQRLVHASFVYIETGQGWDEYLAVRQSIADGEYAIAAASWPAEQSDPYWTFWRNNYAFDPAPYWHEAVDLQGVPALYLFGEEDASDNVDVSLSLDRLTEAVHSNERLRVRIYPGVGHNLRIRPLGPILPDAIAEIVNLAHAPPARRLEQTPE